MKIIKKHVFLLLAILCFSGFLLCVSFSGKVSVPESSVSVERVVISAPILLLLFGGDRFLAADFETIRLAATSVDRGEADVFYLMRSQSIVAKLNPCQEDNYYLANGLLAWGGADQEASIVLLAAMNCRFWDSMPAFFYGFNKSFFQRDLAEAVRALELAAMRAPDRAVAYRKLAVMLRVEGFSDERLALSYLIKQRDAVRHDMKLYEVLEQRVVRLQGLVVLRDAQRRFESDRGPLTDIHELVQAGLLRNIPIDPLGLGYELENGVITLRKLKLGGY